MKKRLLTGIIVGCICTAFFAGCSSNNSGTSKETISDKIGSIMDNTDVLIKHEIYKTATGDGYTEYTGIYYGDKTNILKALTVETQFDKSRGYTKEMMEEQDIDSIFPGFSSMSCAKEIILEDDDTVDVILLFTNLDELKNAQEMVDYDFLSITDGGQLAENRLFDARTIMKDMENNGAEAVSLLDYEDLYIYKFD